MPRAARARAPGGDLLARLRAMARAMAEASDAVRAALRATMREEGLRAAERLGALLELVPHLVGIHALSAASPDLERVLA
jgi:hypothetical protein